MLLKIKTSLREAISNWIPIEIKHLLGIFFENKWET